MNPDQGFAFLKNLEDYEKFSDDQLVERILFHKQRMGSDLVILGHHYQRPKITKLSDFVGDSYGLSEKAAHSAGKNIVFCGVRFMAESAAILAQNEQRVYHPDPDAGCPMADMANIDQVGQAWRQIQTWLADDTVVEALPAIAQRVGATPESRTLLRAKVIPVTYMNSTADLKAFCGVNGGIVCTSSNAEKIYHWAFDRGSKIFFFPDEHLGRNTGKKLGIAPEQMVLWNPKKPAGGLTADQVKQARVILWAGHCPVHMEFKARDIKHVRKYFSGCKVVVHPECDKETVGLADAAGSTDFIVKYVAAQPSGSVTFVGTEVNLVTRLQEMYSDRKIFKLQRSLCLTMYQINLANLCYTLEHLDELETVVLPADVKAGAKAALDRMLALT